MNTVERGDRFEDRVYQALVDELKDDSLGLSPSAAKIFRKKGSFSRDRDSEVVVDISIEVWPPGASNYSLLWICECKDYSHPIPVDDVEEFKAKLDQIAGKNVKGVLATSNSLQRGALNYAQSNGIGVVRILPDDQVRWISRLLTMDSPSRRAAAQGFLSALTHEGHVGENQSFSGVFQGYCIDSWYRLLQRSLRNG